MRLHPGPLLALLLACSSTPTCDAPPRAVTVGGHRFIAEVADETHEQQRGLMGRTELADDAGMLFVWPDVQERSFWMKDTLIPLDLVGIRIADGEPSGPDWEGRVVSVATMEPCERMPCPSTFTEPAHAALEIPGGLAARLGIRPGTKVRSQRHGACL